MRTKQWHVRFSKTPSIGGLWLPWPWWRLSSHIRAVGLKIRGSLKKQTLFPVSFYYKGRLQSELEVQLKSSWNVISLEKVEGLIFLPKDLKQNHHLGGVEKLWRWWLWWWWWQWWWWVWWFWWFWSVFHLKGPQTQSASGGTINYDDEDDNDDDDDVNNDDYEDDDEVLKNVGS